MGTRTSITRFFSPLFKFLSLDIFLLNILYFSSFGLHSLFQEVVVGRVYDMLKLRDKYLLVEQDHLAVLCLNSAY